MDKQQELENLKNKREQQITGIFWFGLEIAVIFAVPAVIAALVAKRLLSGGVWVFVCLAIAFVFSWTVMAFRYKRLSQKMKALDDKILALQKEINE
jgi:Flp pilus assembly protein TadB